MINNVRMITKSSDSSIEAVPGEQLFLRFFLLLLYDSYPDFVSARKNLEDLTKREETIYFKLLLIK